MISMLRGKAQYFDTYTPLSYYMLLAAAESDNDAISR